MNVAERLVSKLPVLGDRVERAPVVSVVRLHGPISPTLSPLARNMINLGLVESALARAFQQERLAAVALSINSPGGAPAQSALITDRIRQLADHRKVPVLAFCEDLTASAGYWLACAADEIYALESSLVGSIGVVSSGFGLHGLLGRVGVDRRVHTAGQYKVRLDPFQREKPEDVVWLKALQERLHSRFIDWVIERRGDKLTADKADVFNGEIWLGDQALELGLIDGIGTLRRVVQQRWPDAEIVIAEPRRPLLARLGLGAPAAEFSSLAAGLVSAGLEALENRAAWSRFGL